MCIWFFFCLFVSMYFIGGEIKQKWKWKTCDNVIVQATCFSFSLLFYFATNKIHWNKQKNKTNTHHMRFTWTHFIVKLISLSLLFALLFFQRDWENVRVNRLVWTSITTVNLTLAKSYPRVGRRLKNVIGGNWFFTVIQRYCDLSDFWEVIHFRSIFLMVTKFRHPNLFISGGLF